MSRTRTWVTIELFKQKTTTKKEKKNQNPKAVWTSQRCLPLTPPCPTTHFRLSSKPSGKFRSAFKPICPNSLAFQITYPPQMEVLFFLSLQCLHPSKQIHWTPMKTLLFSNRKKSLMRYSSLFHSLNLTSLYLAWSS